MNKKKMIIDILMLIILVLLYNLRFTGVLIHEILGLTIWVLFIIHLIFNIKWIKQITKNIFNKKVKSKIKLFYAVDLIIFISFIVVTITGILISRYIFSFNMNLFNLHKLSSIVSAVFIIIHLILHTDFFVRQFTKAMNCDNNKKGIVLTILMIIIATILFMNGLFLNKIKNIINGNSKDNIKENSTNNNLEDDIIASDSKNNLESDQEEELTLKDYLSKLFCTGCARHCPLSNPQCGTGVKQAEDAVDTYYELYSEE